MKTPQPDNDPSKKKVKLTFTQAKLQTTLVTLNDDSKEKTVESPPSPPISTDHYLTIIPKPTLLGKQQAKKRLRAFGLAKSPVKKVIELPKKEPLKPGEEKKNPFKKVIIRNDPAKETVEEIESIKKHEIAVVDASIINCQLMERPRSPKVLERSRRRSDHHHSKSDSKRRSSERRSSERRSSDRSHRHHEEKYPSNWEEVAARNLSLEKLREMDVQKKPYSLDMKYSDAIKMLKFSTPPMIFDAMRHKKTSGQEEFVPAQFIRYTEKSPKISYSANFTRIKNMYFNRTQVYRTVSRGQKDSIKAIISQASEEKPILPNSPLRVRKWYPRASLPGVDPQCQILEPSVGLSILQGYADDEDHEADVKPEAKEKQQIEVKPQIVLKSPVRKQEAKRDKRVAEKNVKESKRKHKKEKRRMKKLEKAKKKMKKLKKRKKKKRKESTSSSSSHDDDSGKEKTDDDDDKGKVQSKDADEDECMPRTDLFCDSDMKSKMIVDPEDLNVNMDNGPWEDGFNSEMQYDDLDISGLSNCEEAQVFQGDMHDADKNEPKLPEEPPRLLDTVDVSLRGKIFSIDMHRNAPRTINLPEDSRRVYKSKHESTDYRRSPRRHDKDLNYKRSPVKNDKDVHYKRSPVRNDKDVNYKRSPVRNDKDVNYKRSPVRNDKDVNYKRSPVRSDKDVNYKRSPVRSDKDVNYKRSPVRSDKDVNYKRSPVRSDKDVNYKRSPVRNDKDGLSRKSYSRREDRESSIEQAKHRNHNYSPTNHVITNSQEDFHNTSERAKQHRLSKSDRKLSPERNIVETRDYKSGHRNNEIKDRSRKDTEPKRRSRSRSNSTNNSRVENLRDIKLPTSQPKQKRQSPLNATRKSKSKRPRDRPSTSNSRTPDTDEYHSHWESEEELKTKNNSWESDEEVVCRSDLVDPKLRQPIKLERCLEMPLNISFRRSRESPKDPPNRHGRKFNVNPVCSYSEDSWEKSDVPFKGDQELKELQKARRTLSEERKLLEIEKRKVAEREKRISICDKFDDYNVEVERVIKQEITEKSESVQELRRTRKSRWEEPVPVALDPNIVIKQEQTDEYGPELQEINLPAPEAEVVEKSMILEDEYEQFMRAVSSNTPESELPGDEQPPLPQNVNVSRKRKYSSSSSTSTESSHSSSSSSSTSESSAPENINVTPLEDVPLPVPSPKLIPSELGITTIYGKNLSSFNSDPITSESPNNCTVDSTSSPLKKPHSHEIALSNNLSAIKNLSDVEHLSEVDNLSAIDLENRKPLTSIVIAKKSTQLLDNSVFRDSDDSDAGKNVHKLEPLPPKVLDNVVDKPEVIKMPNTISDDVQARPRSRDSVRRESSPKRRSPPRRSGSPRRRYSPSRHQSPMRKRGGRELSPRRRYRDRYSPRRNRDSSPRYRDRSPRRNRSISPLRRKRSRSHSKERKGETIQEALTRIAGMDRYEHNRSPVDSPLDGFRRSLADSTISDEQLMQNQEQYSGSPAYFTSNVQFKSDIPSPKRIPLDDRINQVLGLEKEEPKPITTTYSREYQSYNPPGYYEQFGNYNSQDYESKNYDFEQQKEVANVSVTKVLQIGNVLQVVPAEDIPTITTTRPTEPAKECSQKILQVGNMLQIVPTTTFPLVEPVTPVKEKKSAEDLMKLKLAERKADREKRRLERERRRKEKEKKRKEREKRRQLKMKQKTEEMIKRALLTEAEGNDEDADDYQDAKEGLKPWPSIPSILSTGSKPIGKGILVLTRKRFELQEEGERQKKGVKFADGVIPGEGTSPSGGEELSSPPPVSMKALKEKRFTKTKKPKKVKQPKKKIKVQVIRKSQPKPLEVEEEEDEDDNLPPPSPPPGSPPPHVFPARIKPIPPTPTYVKIVPPPPVNYQYPAAGCRSVDSPHFMQQTTVPPPVVPVYSQTVPPPRVHHLPPPPQVVLHHGTHYPPPGMQHHQPPPILSHQGMHGLPQQVGNLRNIPLKQTFNTSISPPQHLHGPHHG